MNEQSVLYEKKENIVTITINRPEKHNVLNSEVRNALREAWQRFEFDDETRVAVLTGAGDKDFCAGMDLKEMAGDEMHIPPPDFIPYLGRNIFVSKPVIAAVNGVALGGGWLMAQMCDLCIAAEHAKFGIPVAKVGRGAPWAAPLLWMIPQRIMMELLLTGEPVTAQRAYEIGFVNRVVPKEKLMEATYSMAGTIAKNAPLTIKGVKRMIYLAAEMGRSAALNAADVLFEQVYLSEDVLEGPKAFVEKRKPIWKNN